MNAFDRPDSFPGVVGLYSSRAQSGKSSVADALVRDCGFVRVKMADGLKDMLRAVLRLQGAFDSEIEAMLEGDAKTDASRYLNFHTPRHAMQTLGTEWGRTQMGDLFWPNLTYRRVAKLVNQGHSVVIDDIRFPSDAEMVRNFHNGFMVRITRTDLPTAPWFKRLFKRGHKSEGLLDKQTFDVEIYNSPEYQGLDEFQADAVTKIQSKRRQNRFAHYGDST